MHFLASLSTTDSEISKLINQELERQCNHIELIASENFTSKAVLEVQGSILTNKYAEGYPSKRYYDGCTYVDQIENIAIERAKKLFNCGYANVQPHSGSQANQAAYLGLLEIGDTILGMSLNSGGHLTHGAHPSFSGKWFKSISYSVNPISNLIDYDEVRKLAKIHRPKLIICGYSAYPRQFSFAEFRKIADEVGAYLLADIAHIAGLVVTNTHPSPFPHAHIVTSTTHKTLRGPRGGLILCNDETIAKKIDHAIFPGLQGGPLMHVIAGKAVAFLEAMQPEYNDYIKQVIINSRALSDQLSQHEFTVVTEGTDNHLVLVDLRNKNLTGKQVSTALAVAGIICNKNNIPFDDASPFITSGIRLGTPACSTRGFREQEFRQIADMINAVVSAQSKDENFQSQVTAEVQLRVKELCDKFPLY